MIFTRLWKNLTILKVAKNLLAATGVLWTIIKVFSYFGGDELIKFIKPLWWVFLLIGIIYTVCSCWPKNEYTFQIPNRDSKVILMLKNVFEIQGSLIIPINNKMQVNPGGILDTTNSILSQLVKNFYDEKHFNLQNEINIELKKDIYKENNIKEDIYKIGTVVPVRAKGNQFYILANTNLNPHNRSVMEKGDLEQSLNELWTFLANHAGKEKFIIPIIGSGRGRITLKREEIIKEIVLSFLASNSSRTYAEKLIISVYPQDISEHKMNIEELVKWIEAKVKYADFQKRNLTTGTNVM